MKKITVLIADDEYGFRFPFVIYLKSKGLNVAEASTEEEIFNRISEVDILMMDVIFPYHKEGIDIVKKIRENENDLIRSIPVIFYSILPENTCQDELKNLNKKFYFWLQKPFKLEILCEIIKKCLKISNLNCE